MAKSRRMSCAGHIAGMEKIKAYGISVVKSEGNRSKRRLWHKWADNIKMCLRGIGLAGKDYIVWIRIGAI
jgi:hypothetical protein